MDWTNELFVRLYVRDTADWKVLPWQARCLFPLLLRCVDRAGVLETRHGVKGVAALVDMPVDVVEPGLAALLEDGSVTQHDRGYLLPNFIDAQEANKSDKVRAKEYRDKRRTKALSDVTRRDANVTTSDAGVTSHHAASHGVTLRREEERQGERSSSAPPPTEPPPSEAGEGLRPKANGKAKSERQPPAPRAGSAPPPLPFTARQLGQAFARGAGPAFAMDSWDAGLAKPVTSVIRSLGEAGRTLEDIESAGRVVAGWRMPEAFTWSWLATAGKLAGAIAKAKNGATHARPKAAVEEW